MEITEVDIKKIKADPEQPRKFIDETDLREMAQSIVTEGVINAIEIDKDFVIITGERRWRAAGIAGLKTVPVKILDIGKDERFMRQVIENIHNNTMSDWDTCNALTHLLASWPKSSQHPSRAPLSGATADQGIRRLSKKIGKSRAYVAEKLSLVKTSLPIQERLQDGTLSGTFVRAITRAPKQHVEAVTEKILANEFPTSSSALSFVTALKRQESNPEKTKKLLETDYSKYKTDHEAKEAIFKIAPQLHAVIATTYEPSKVITKIADDLRDWIAKNPKQNTGMVHAPRVLLNMTAIRTLVTEWFNNVDQPKLLGK